MVALLINLVSAYAKPPIDNILGRFSATRRRLNEAKQTAFSKLVAETANSADATLLLFENEMRHRLSSLTWLLFAILMGVQFVMLRLIGHRPTEWEYKSIMELATLLVSMIFLVLSFIEWRAVMRIAPIARAARQARKTR